MSGSLPRLLLIDDDAISREVLAMMLEMHGFAVAAVETGEEALGIDCEIDAVLMDTQMPGLSGLELIQALRQVTKARIVAISGSDPGVAIREAADGFLLKPIAAESVVALLAGGTTAAADAEATDSPAELIDPVVLGKLKAMMSAKALREIYTAVATDLKSRLGPLQAAVDAGDDAEMRRIAHAIKGGCAMVGLTGAMQAAAQLESSNVPVTSPEAMGQLRSSLIALEVMLGRDFPA